MASPSPVLPAANAPTPEDLRARLLERASAYAGALDRSLSTVSRWCDGDSSFLPSVAKGDNFTVDRYWRSMRWFEENWPPAVPEPKRRSSTDVVQSNAA